MKATSTLHFRYGDAVQNPTEPDFRRAATELFVEKEQALTESDFQEHPNSWLEMGSANGDQWTVITLDIYRGGLARLTKYADQDDAEPEFEYSGSGIDAVQAVEFWKMLRDGRVDELVIRFKLKPSKPGQT